MKNYKVTITETFQMDVEVEAESQAEAEKMVSDGWCRSDYVLDSDYFDGVNFEAEEVTKTKEIREDFGR